VLESKLYKKNTYSNSKDSQNIGKNLSNEHHTQKTFKNLSEKIKKVISHEKIAVAPESAIATNPFHCFLECDITKIGITAKRQG